jgi:site-specific DNA-cytosine methylase
MVACDLADALTVGANQTTGFVGDDIAHEPVFFTNRGEVIEDAHETLRSASHGSLPMVNHFGVRRLTPLECERLMGWPDEHTRWTADGEEISDSHRYRMCGNGVVATVAEWIGWRLMTVDRNLNLETAQ